MDYRVVSVGWLHGDRAVEDDGPLTLEGAQFVAEAGEMQDYGERAWFPEAIETPAGGYYGLHDAVSGGAA